MNYELHDWQRFPEENIDPCENIVSSALCVRLPLMLMESLKRQISLVCMNGCKVDVAKTCWKKKIP